MSESRDIAAAIAKLAGRKAEKATSTMRKETRGRVVRVNPDGTAVVDAGDGGTPASSSSVAVRVGDEVSVTVSDGKATISGNFTRPATDDEKAREADGKATLAKGVAETANRTADQALMSAESAVKDAARAHEAADQAVEDAATAQAAAEAVEGLAEQASEDAAAASTAASNAITAANKAAYALSDVERVVGTVNWIAEHGTWTAATETAPVADRIYYTRTGSGTSQDPYKYTVVPEVEQTDNPASLGWYYLVVDESVQAYLASHLWLDNYGLNLSVDSANGYRIHQGTVDGTKPVGAYIIDPDGEAVAKFGADGAQIGLDGENHLTLGEDSMSITNADGVPAFNVDLDSGVAYSYATEPAETASAVTGIRATTSGYTLNYSRVTDVSGAVSGTAITGSSGQVLLLQMYPDETATFGTSSATVSSGMSVSGNNSKTLTVTVTQRTATAGTSKTITRSATGIKWGSNARRTLDVVATWTYDATAGTLTETIAVTFKAESTVLYNFSQLRRTLRKLQYYIASTAPAFSLGTRALDSTIGAFSAIVGEDLHATQQNQVAIGKHNVEDTNGDYALIIGNGTDDNARSNALVVDWDGAIECATDTAWITLNSYIKYRIHHGVCYVLGVSRSGGAAVGPAGGNIGTLPEGARPLAEVIGTTTTMAKQFGQFSIGTNGVITVWNMTQSSAYWAFNTSYPVG